MEQVCMNGISLPQWYKSVSVEEVCLNGTSQGQ